MDNNKYPKITHFKSWWIIAYAVTFFILINIIIFFLSRNSYTTQVRLSNQDSFQEIQTVIEKINNDHHRKVVFLGGSAMWGGRGVAHAEDTFPLQLKNYFAPDVDVYNLAYAAARPLDQFIIATQIKNVDLFIVDINSGFLTDEYNQGFKEDYSKYIRVHDLLGTYRNDLFSKSSKTKSCLNDAGVFPEQDYSYLVTNLVPLLRYKDAINFRFFGKHFALSFEYILNSVFNAFKPGYPAFKWSNIFTPIAEDIDPTPGRTVIATPPQELHPTLNSCLASSFSAYADKLHMPVLFYLSPHSPIMTKQQRLNPTYNHNLAFISSIFENNAFINFDSSTSTLFSGDDFVDEVHFTVTGHQTMARALASYLKASPLYRSLTR